MWKQKTFLPGTVFFSLFAYMTPCCLSSSFVFWLVSLYNMNKLSFALSWLSGFLLRPISSPFLPAWLSSLWWLALISLASFLSGRALYMCILSLNAERVLVKLTDGVTTGCHLTWRTTPKSLHLQLWAFKRLYVRQCTLSSRNNHTDEHLVFMMLKCILSVKFYFSLIQSMLVLCLSFFIG